ncbi:MAG TPA: hypothetical protein VI112_18320 [Bacteroidia bacterium]|jgi:hypothetical protein
MRALLLLALTCIIACHPAGKESGRIKTAGGNKQELSCKLTSPQLQERKETVLAQLKKEVVEKKELADGYSFKFSGADSVYIQLSDFIRSERTCCDFFTFRLEVSDEKSFTWLTVTGPPGTKEFIKNEMDL